MEQEKRPLDFFSEENGLATEMAFRRGYVHGYYYAMVHGATDDHLERLLTWRRKANSGFEFPPLHNSEDK